jgi:hypothetical protein
MPLNIASPAALSPNVVCRQGSISNGGNAALVRPLQVQIAQTDSEVRAHARPRFNGTAIRIRQDLESSHF